MEHEALQERNVRRIAQELMVGGDPHPITIEIHPTNHCNQNCSGCFHLGAGTVTDEERISLNEYERLIREWSRLGVREISVSGGGEPFIDWRTPHILEQIHTAGLRSRVVTNGSVLSDSALEQLVLAQEVRFSVDAIKPETYALLRVVDEGVFSDVINNISRVVSLRRRKDSLLRIGASFLFYDQNMDEAMSFAHAMKGLGVDDVLFKHNVYGTGPSKEELVSIIRQLREENLDGVEVRDWTLATPKNKPCFIPFFKTALDPYGNVYSCCLGSQPRETNGYLLGSVKQASFRQVWERSRPLRQQLFRSVGCDHCNHTDYALNRALEEVWKYDI